MMLVLQAKRPDSGDTLIPRLLPPCLARHGDPTNRTVPPPQRVGRGSPQVGVRFGVWVFGHSIFADVGGPNPPRLMAPKTRCMLMTAEP